MTATDDKALAVVPKSEQSEAYVEEEEIIKVEEKSVQKRADKKKRVSRKKSEEEEIVIVEEETEKKKQKKVLKAKKPLDDQETVIEEVTETLEVKPAERLSISPVRMPAQVSETTPADTVSMIGEVPTSGVKGNLSVITFSAIEQQQVEQSEKETDRPETVLPVSSKAKTEIDTMEPYIVTEPQVESVAEEFSKTFKPSTKEATRVLIEKEGLIISETSADHTVKETEIFKQEKSQAIVSMLLHEAKSVSETEVSLKEGDFEQLKKPFQAKATPGLNLQESVNVTEVTQSVKEEKLEEFSVQGLTKPKVDIQQRESVIVSEVLSETKPSRYFPELFVPTESATASIVAQQNTALTEELNLPEKEGEYKPSRLPQGQFAGMQILPEDSIVVSETNIHEKEIAFGPGQKPGETVANKEFNVLESLVVSLVQHQDNESILEITKPEKKHVDVQFTKNKSVVTQETNVAESEEVFKANEVPGAKTAVSSITCLEIPKVSETISNEIAEEYSPQKAPMGTMAEMVFQPIEPISITEIKAEDTPVELTDLLRYQTTVVSPQFQTLESKEITEVLTQDSERPMSDFDIPVPINISKTFVSQEGISVFQTETNEKEGEYAAYVSPEMHTGKTVPQQPLQSLIVQEITSESDVEDISKTQLHSAHAKLKHTTFQETVVEETVLGEMLATQKESFKPEGKTADVNVLEEQSVSVTEVITDFKEDEFSKEKSPQKCFASQSHLPQKVAVKSETIPELATSPLSHKTPPTTVAKQEQMSFESIVVSSVEVAESEKEFKKDTSPIKSKANVEVAEQFSGVTVEEIVSSEKEMEHVSKGKPAESKASKSITPHYTALQSETLPEINLGSVPKVDMPSGRAKVDNTPFQEVVVTETNITEIETSLDTLKPEFKTATVGIRAGESFSISEVVAEDKEDVFKSAQLPESRKATLNLSGQEVAEQEEVVQLIQEGTWERQSPVKEQAQRKQDAIQLAVASQQVPSEAEGHLETPVKPSEKVASVTFVEGNVLSVTEMSAVDKEIPLEQAKAPKTAIATSDITGQDVAVTSEVVVDISVGDVNVLKLDLSEAQIKQSTHESVILRETTVGESEGEYIPGMLPETKTANQDIVEGHNTTVSSIITVQDKESILITPDRPKEQLATPSITGQDIAEKTEIILGSSLKILEQETPTSAFASAQQIPFHSLIQSETSPNELETPMQTISSPISKTADVSIEDNQAVSVFVISAQDEPTLLVPESKPETQFATTEILPQRVAEASIVVPESTTDKFTPESPSKALANLEPIPHEGILTTVTSTSEKEFDFEGKLRLDLKKADKLFEEEIGLSVSEVITEQKEEGLKSFTKPKEVSAFVGISSTEAAQTLEVLTEYNIEEMPKFEKQVVAASKDQLPYESLIQTQTVVHESENIYVSKDVPSSNIAQICLEEEKGVIVTEITSDDKEGHFESPVLPDEINAELDFIPFIPHQKAEIVPVDTFGEMNEKPLEHMFAKSVQTTLHSVSLKQMVVGESEAHFDDFIKPFSKKAETSFESAKTGLTINEVTIQEKEGELEGPVKPTESTAEQIMLPREIASKSEVLVESTVEEFEDNVESSRISVSIEQVPLQTVTLTEVSLEEKEGIFKSSVTPDQKNAGVSFEEGQGVSIVEVVAGDMENTFLPGEIPNSTKASVNISAREVAIKTEVIAESSLQDRLNEEVQPLRKVSIQQVPFESIITTKTDVNEKETVLDTFVKTESTANVAFEEGKGIHVMQVLVEDKESQLQLPDKPKEQTATQDVTAHGIAEQSLVQTEDSLSELSEFDKKPVQATKEQIPYETIETIVPSIVENEGTFDTTFKPETRKAHPVIDENLTVSVLLTTPEDKENDLLVQEKPKELVAVSSISELGVAEQLEYTLQQSVDKFEQPKTVVSTASPKQTPLESLIQTELIIRESESTFEGSSKTEERRASISFVTGQSVNVSEVTLGETGLDFTGSFKPKDNKATVVLSDIQEVAKQLEITPEDSVGSLVQDDVIKQSATSEQVTFQSLTISESLPEEKETEFAGKFKPETKRADVLIEKGKKVQSTSEIIPEYKEGSIAPLILPEQKNAVADITGREIAETSETITQMTVEEVFFPGTKGSVALRSQTLHESSIKEEVMVQEKEEQMIKPTQKPGKASLSFEEGEGLVITEVTVEDSEIPYSTDTPLGQIAHKKITPKEATEITEVCPELQPSEMVVKVPDQATAKIDQPGLTCLIQSEVNVHEGEVKFKSETAEGKTAYFSFEEGKGINVLEVLVEDKEDKLKPFEKPLSKTAIPVVIPKDHLEAIEVQPEHSISELVLRKPEEVTASEDQLVHESILITQNLMPEHEEKLEDQKMSPAVTAQVDFIAARQVAAKSEVITSVTTEELPSTETRSSFATTEAILQESLIQSEINLNESENELPNQELPKKRKASVVKDVQEGVEVKLTVVAEKEGLHQVPETPLKIKPSSTITEQETLVQTEVVVSSSTTNMEKVKAPQTLKIKPEAIPFESFKTETVNIQEKESDLNASWKPSTSEGVQTVQEMSGISITEVIPNEKVEDSLLEDKATKQVAEPKFINQEVAVKSEVIPELPVTPFTVEKRRPSVAKQTTPIQHHMVVTSHETGEVEDRLPDTVTPAAKSIAIDVEEHKTTLMVTQVHPQESPGKISSYFKPRLKGISVICIFTSFGINNFELKRLPT